ncbi:Imm26 family immunity protein [Rhodopirellula sp. MGV]|uniref:Imm26 family immunity protein n=1 Tax=Rhodopirellula sp. MGV TaxID=2023130 RepID=UPI000B96C0F5|nr:Imm26 family immunity protein [Rhodopirellula sp. MGV]OYP35457.1 hypothetical protein CGZ80_11485 [Rhodopirellula sp. MGV]PNY33897.1 hypothetical protein C2E31_26110 [Rhodopirellula baltica]
MGWLTANKDAAGADADGLAFSDSGLDACSDFLQQFATHYQDELGRLPSVAEIAFHLETALNGQLSESLDDEIKSVAAITIKTKKRPAKPKAVVGDFVAIPLVRDKFAVGQVVEVLKRDDVVIELLDLLTNGMPNLAAASEASPLSQFRIEQTGVHWQHWKIIGNRDVPSNYAVKKVAYSLPCFVAELEFVDALRSQGKLPSDFKLYADLNASHPSLQESEFAAMTEIMSFLQKKQLLSNEGLAEFADGKLPGDFSLHSGLLTKSGIEFYDKVFKKDLQSGYFSKDTTARIEAFWDENQ